MRGTSNTDEPPGTRHRWLGHSLARGAVLVVISLVLILRITITGFAAGFLDSGKVAALLPPPPTAAVPGPTAVSHPERLQPPGLRSPGTRPPSGWLYVLDSNEMEPESQVLLVDSASGTVAGSYRAGYAPEIVLSPDGSRLYIASQYARQGRLAVVDTTTGQTLQTVDLPDRKMYAVRPVVPNMAVSPDGRWLYILKLRIVTPGQDDNTVAIFDTVNGRFLPSEVSLPDCTDGWLPAASQQLQVLCGETRGIRFVSMTSTGPAATTKAINLRPAAQPHQAPAMGNLVGGAPGADGRVRYLVTDNGHLFAISGDTQQVTRSTQMEQPADTYIPFGIVTLSPDGAKLYAGVGNIATRSQRMADTILAIDPLTGKQLASITPSQPFWSMAVSHDGQRLYATNPDQRSVIVVDIVTNREVTLLHNIGITPTMIAIAP